MTLVGLLISAIFEAFTGSWALALIYALGFGLLLKMVYGNS